MGQKEQEQTRADEALSKMEGNKAGCVRLQKPGSKHGMLCVPEGTDQGVSRAKRGDSSSERTNARPEFNGFHLALSRGPLPHLCAGAFTYKRKGMLVSGGEGHQATIKVMLAKCFGSLKETGQGIKRGQIRHG